MKSLRRLALPIWLTVLMAIVPAQEAPGAPSVVLQQIPADVRYPPIVASARVRGRIDVRVEVRPDGTVADVTVFPQTDMALRLLSASAADATARASFECRAGSGVATSRAYTTPLCNRDHGW